MPGDEVHEEADAVAKAVAEAGRARVGPRHAAPRKPFLTRLHMPAGKAIAMAAMPSAVLMGMGLTPQLASAKPVPKSPFKDGPCVSAPDKDEEAEKEAAKKAAEEKAAKEAAAKKKAAEKKAAAEKEAAEKKAAEEKAAQEKAEAEKEDSGSTGSSGSGDTGTEQPEPSPSGSDAGSGSDAESEKNPLDPLGLGDAVEDLLTPEEKEAAEEEQAAEEKAAEEKAAAESSADSGKDGLTKPVEDTVDEVEKGLEDTTDALEESAENAQGAKDGLEKTTPSGTDEEKEAAGKDENGEKAFPCVEEKKVDGENEQTPVTLPNQPWHLEASSLALHGLDYEGVVNVRTANGGTKQALKFTAKSVDIGDLHQIVDGPDGVRYHVEAAKGSNSTIRDGQVTMYTERLEGNLFGLIPIVFDPEHPPPLNIPEAYFTKVKVKQAGQFGGTLTIPGLQQSITR